MTPPIKGEPRPRGLITGDCLEVMAGMDPESVDAIVCDPPYGLEFMGKEWDKPWAAGFSTTGYTDEGKRMQRPSFSSNRNPVCLTCHKHQSGTKRCVCPTPTFDETARTSSVLMQRWHQQWAEAAYRVAKPSAYLLAFGGTRTVHRMTVALEDAGWVIRDMLVWAYASGFPKSKASLKPAWEPIVMARKPGPLRMLNIDGCRLPLAGDDDFHFMESRLAAWNRKDSWEGPAAINPGARPEKPNAGGRWPANVILTDPIFDGGVEGVVGGGEAASGGNINGRPVTGYGGHWADSREFDGYGDSGTYSRFFLIPKADRADREPVFGGLEAGTSVHVESAFSEVCAKCNRQRVNVPGAACQCPDPEWTRRQQKPRVNGHPTVKPTELMRHLVRLVTPPGGLVLDPFLGSGTTAIACEMEGFPWVGIEREAEYVRIAEARLQGVQRGMGLSA